MRRPIAVASTAVALLSLVALQSVAGQYWGAGQVHVTRTSIDLGRISRGAERADGVSLANLSWQPAVVTATAGCSCLAVTPRQQTVGSYGIVRLTVSAETPGAETGPHRECVTISVLRGERRWQHNVSVTYDVVDPGPPAWHTGNAAPRGGDHGT